MKNLRIASMIVLLGLTLLSTSALTQQQIDVAISIKNVCSQSVLVIQQITLTLRGTPIATQFLIPGRTINPGETANFTLKASSTPTDLNIRGTLDQTGFSVTFDPLTFNTPLRDQGEAKGCLEVIVQAGGTGQPPTGQKPLAPGQSLEQVLQALQGLGLNLTTEGSQASPKLPNVSDPMLLRAIPGLSVQLLFVSAPGTLRSVITWDRPAVDLDLIVIGTGFCFQLNPVGLLAETCDRAPFGPVPGVIFAVLIINWSTTPQAYVLSLSP